MVAGIVILIVVLSDKKKKEQYQLNSQQPVTPMNQSAASINHSAASINHSAASIKQSMASMKKPMVYAMSPQLQGMKKELSERPILLGRAKAECAVIFPEGTPGISRRHCSLSWDAVSGNFILIDMQSAYGTYLQNGQRLNPGVAYYLKAGEGFYLGENKNMFRVNLE